MRYGHISHEWDDYSHLSMLVYVFIVHSGDSQIIRGINDDE